MIFIQTFVKLKQDNFRDVKNSFTWDSLVNRLLLFADLHVLLLEDLLILLQKQDDKLVLKCLSTTVSAGYQDVKVTTLDKSCTFLFLRANNFRGKHVS